MTWNPNDRAWHLTRPVVVVEIRDTGVLVTPEGVSTPYLAPGYLLNPRA